MNLYLVDVGTLLDNTDPEYTMYSIVYDKQYAYYDYDQYFVRTKDEAINDAKEYVKTHGEDSYAVISVQTGFDDDLSNEDLEFIDLGLTDYSIENVVYSVANINGKIIENFIEKE